MRGLEPRIRVSAYAKAAKAWMAGTKPGHDGSSYASISIATSKFGAECVSAPDET